MTVIATKTISAPCPRVVAEGSQLGNASNPTACGAASFRATEIGDSIVVVTVSGEVDLSSADGLREFTLSRIDDRRDLVLDLSAVDFCGTATLAVFTDRFRMTFVVASNR
ncbi:anti-sigma factor antagonist [Rhodococcus rhodnii]|uniref:Anti-sigma factor antagonist n=3 Tax=Rhodococcus rhodnii TaxID=38312 RepID=A0A6P2CI96_9NOCA|nr:STAS domain-containing protein [Rhodococcus rhodnii]TXG92022.1 anti-sigma factor antagonist [Rhodococcus rhodnii]